MERVRELRRERGMSQSELSRASGVDVATLSQLENGHHVPTLGTLAKLAEAMEIEMADFFPKVQAPLFEPSYAAQRGVAEGSLAFPWSAVIRAALARWEELLGDHEWPDDTPIWGLVDAAIDLCDRLHAEVRVHRDEEALAISERLVEFASKALAQVQPEADDEALAEARREEIRELTRRIAS